MCYQNMMSFKPSIYWFIYIYKSTEKTNRVKDPFSNLNNEIFYLKKKWASKKNQERNLCLLKEKKKREITKAIHVYYNSIKR